MSLYLTSLKLKFYSCHMEKSIHNLWFCIAIQAITTQNTFLISLKTFAVKLNSLGISFALINNFDKTNWFLKIVIICKIALETCLLLKIRFVDTSMFLNV